MLTIIRRITPMAAIGNEVGDGLIRGGRTFCIGQKGLSLGLAMRQLTTGKKQYISACIVTILLVFFASLVGRMDAWLEPDGIGLMDAFNPAEHDVAVQIMGDLTRDEIEGTISSYSPIRNQYQLAMPSVTVNGVDYTANVISVPEHFHILQGRICTNPNEVVLTEFLARDLNVGIGDTVTAASGMRKRRVCGCRHLPMRQ